MDTSIRWDAIDHFEPGEFACKCGCGTNNPSKDLVYKLNAARRFAGITFTLNSACRCTVHNAVEGGLDDSAHLASLIEYGEAVDIKARTSAQKFRIVEGLMKAGFKRILIYGRFVHADVDSDKPSPVLKGM